MLTVHQTDSAPLSVLCPSNYSADVDPTVKSIPVFYTEPNVTDSSGEILTTQSHRPGDNFSVGETAVYYNFHDYSGNQAMCNFSVYVMNGRFIMLFSMLSYRVYVKSLSPSSSTNFPLLYIDCLITYCFVFLSCSIYAICFVTLCPPFSLLFLVPFKRLSYLFSSFPYKLVVYIVYNLFIEILDI